MNFYQVVIGSEILNGRRKDSHFDFLKEELLKRGQKLKASFFIEDDPKLIEDIFMLVKGDEEAVMFSFGGIGATPDDYTREVAAKVFGDGRLYEHPEAKSAIEERFKEQAYPHRIEMAKLPKESKLLKNPVTNVPGFYLHDRFFFVPGFPSMAHPMVKEALTLLNLPYKKSERHTICVEASENDLMDLMKLIPKELDFSSLPGFKDGRPYDVLSLEGEGAQEWMDFLKTEIEKRGFRFKEGERC